MNSHINTSFYTYLNFIIDYMFVHQKCISLDFLQDSHEVNIDDVYVRRYQKFFDHIYSLVNHKNYMLDNIYKYPARFNTTDLLFNEHLKQIQLNFITYHPHLPDRDLKIIPGTGKDGAITYNDFFRYIFLNKYYKDNHREGIEIYDGAIDPIDNKMILYIRLSNDPPTYVV